MIWSPAAVDAPAAAAGGGRFQSSSEHGVVDSIVVAVARAQGLKLTMAL